MPHARLHICHLSLLNPALHSRIFFKMARTQVQAGHRVTIIAQDAAKGPYVQEGVEIVPLGVFGRMSGRRIWSVSKIAKHARALQADVYQVHAVELLPMARKLKASLPHCKIIFDMHEDYVANIRFADYYSDWTRQLLIGRVQAILDDFPKWGDGLLLAEDCFQGLVAMDAACTAVVRNKYQAPAVEIEPEGNILNGLPYMLHSGTIAENWGVLKAIELWTRFNHQQPLGLVIAGHGHDRTLLQTIRERVASSGLQDRFLLAGGDEYLPFEQVVKYIQHCTFGLALYTLKENIKDRIPTKFYEYMAHGKPLLFTANPTWDMLNATHNFGLSLDWPATEAALLQVQATLVGHERHPQLPKSMWSWESEAPTMLNLIQRIANP